MNRTKKESIELPEYIASISKSMESLVAQAQDLSSDSTDTKEKKRGLSRITYGLFSTGILVAIATNLLMVSINATSTQLLLANFSTMILIALGGISLLNDLVLGSNPSDSNPVELKNQIKSISENIEHLNQITFDWNRKLQFYKEQSFEKESEIAQLEEKAASIEGAIEVSDAELNQLRSELEIISKDIVTKNSQVANLLWDAESARTKKEELEIDLSSSKEQLQGILAEITICEQSLPLQKIECETLESKKNQILSELEDLENRMEELQLESTSLEKEIEERTATLQCKNESIEKILLEEDSIQKEIAAAIERLESLCTLEVLHTELGSVQSSIQACIENNESLEQDRLVLEKDKLDLESELQALRETFGELQIACQEKDELHASIEASIAQAKNEASQLEDQIKESKYGLTQIAEQELLNLDVRECNLILNTKRDEFAALQERDSELRDIVFALSREASDIDAILSENRTHLDQLIAQILEKSEELQRLTAAESSSQEQIQNAEKQLRELENDVKTAQVDRDNLSMTNSEARTESKQLELEIDRKNSQCTLLDNQLDRKLDELKQMEESIKSLNEQQQSLNELCNDAEERISVLADKSELMAKHLTTTTESLQSLETCVSEKSIAIATMEQVSFEKARLIESLDGEIAERNRELENLSAEQASYLVRNTEALRDIEQIRTNIQELEKIQESLSSIVSERDSVVAEIQTLRSEIEALVAKREDIVLDCHRINAAIKISRSRVDENDRMLEKTTNDLLQAELQLGRANEAYCVVQADAQQLNASMKNEQAILAGLEVQIDKLSDSKEMLKQELQLLGVERERQLDIQATHQEEIRSLEHAIAVSHEKIANLAEQIAQSERLKIEIFNATDKLNLLNQTVAVTSEKLSEVEIDRNTQEDRLLNLQAESKQIAATISKGEKSLLEITNKVEQAQNALADFDARRASARKELDAIEQCCSKSKLISESITADISALELKRVQTRTELDRCSAEVLEAQAICKQWQEYSETLQRNNRELESEIRLLEKQIESTRAENKKSEFALEQNQISVKHAASQRDKLLSEIAGLENKRRDLVHSEDALNYSLESKRALLKEIDAELDHGRMNVDNAILEFEQTRLKCKTEKGILSELVAQHDELLREISNRSELHEQQTRRCDDLKTQEHSLQMKLTHLKEKISSFQEQEKLFSEKRAQWEELSTAYSRKSIEFEGIQHSIAANRDQIKSVLKELEETQSELANKEKLRMELTEKLAQQKFKYGQEIHQQEEKLVGLTKEIEAKREFLQTTETSIRNAVSQRQSLDAELTSCSTTIEEKQAAIASLESQHKAIADSKCLIESDILQLRDEITQLQVNRIQMLGEIKDCEEQRQLSASKYDEDKKNEEVLAVRLQELSDRCTALDVELQLKRDMLCESEQALSAREQQIVETLQAITLIGQQRELAQTRLDADLAVMEATHKKVEDLEVHKLDCESLLHSITTEVSRMITNRELLDSEIRKLELRHQDLISDKEMDTQHVVQESPIEFSTDETISSIQSTLDDLIALSPMNTPSPIDLDNNRADISPDESSSLMDNSTRIDGSEISPKVPAKHLTPNDIWGDLLREVRIA